MAVQKLAPALRDHLADSFRAACFQKTGFVPFYHQAQWMAAAAGLRVIDQHARPDQPGVWIRLRESRHGRRFARLRVKARTSPTGGIPIRARVLANLGAYKTGKSQGMAAYLSGFAAVPMGRIQLIGLEYDICTPEFEYLLEMLLSGAGMNLPYKTLWNQPRSGRMLLELRTGARFECRSWERKDILKGKEIDVYAVCEAYMLPGAEVYNSLKQNLRARDGTFVATTTADRPWVGIFHKYGHGELPDWHCTCGVEGSANPFTFDREAMARDDPDKGGMMSREEFEVKWKGRINVFVGRVFTYTRGSITFTPDTDPLMWDHDKLDTLGLVPEALKIPDTWTIHAAVDTGTYFGGIILAMSPGPDPIAYVLEEYANYRYVVDHDLELLDLTTDEWGQGFTTRLRRYVRRGRLTAWADRNTQFKRDLRSPSAGGLILISNLRERSVRTAVTRSYFHNDRIRLAPWLTLLPLELELAEWPPETTATGKHDRIKKRDHLLDGVEHILSRRPRSSRALPAKTRTIETFKDRYLRENRLPPGDPLSARSHVDPHLGSQ